MPRGVYNVKCPNTKKKTKFIPQEHQTHVKEWVAKSTTKGIVLIHKLGSGKTCTSIVTADLLLSLEKVNKIYVLTPGSLRQGWIDEYCNTCGLDNIDKYVFVTYNYAVANQLPANFDKSLVIIDEAHNFINGVKNEATTYTAIYNKLLTSDCKILLLSGTPIYNSINEWNIINNLFNTNARIDDILKYCKQNDNGTIEVLNPDAIRNLVYGTVSFFPGAGEEYYPKVIYHEPFKIPMTPEQTVTYINVKTNEDILARIVIDKKRNKGPNLEFLKIMAIKRIFSRAVSNFFYPQIAYEPVVEKRNDPTNEDIDLDIITQKLKPDLLNPDGWVEKQYFNNKQLINNYSPKMAKLFQVILDNYKSKHMVFTFFKEHSGVNILSTLCKMCGIKYGVFSGDLTDAKRKELLKIFNSPANRFGDLIKIIFVTDAGAEGITLLEVGHIHILESDRRESKIQQVIGRGVRYKSHYNMPKHLQVVNVWRYWSVEAENKFKCIDEILFEEGRKKMNTINSFADILIKNSI
jgi:superfamily II DNA or RNA helicase